MYQEKKENDPEWYQKILERHREWRENNREHLREYYKKYNVIYYQNPENRERRKERDKIWKENNPEKHRINNANAERIRRHRLRNVGDFTIKEWKEIKEKYDYTCQICGEKEPNIELTIDHIVPICRGGKNIMENIQPLCRYCNCSVKRTKLMEEL